MTGTVNPDRINQKMADVKEALTTLEEYAKLPDADFLHNRERIRSARYSFIILAEAATNIAGHICARIFDKAPVTYGDSFSILAENNVLDQSLAARLGKMVGLRNLLVHRYETIDDRKMLEIMRNDLGNFRTYLHNIARYLSREGSEI
ncbi:MAG: DUF86 domain-containing protein [Peptococcaceae bacterium]|jgi:uncharacterized protein YutE (UPF0331/DUF86 family)|nr:DUF86 domain-containing protein [Peptococcaceae bacterium]